MELYHSPQNPRPRSRLPSLHDREVPDLLSGSLCPYDSANIIPKPRTSPMQSTCASTSRDLPSSKLRPSPLLSTKHLQQLNRLHAEAIPYRVTPKVRSHLLNPRAANRRSNRQTRSNALGDRDECQASSHSAQKRNIFPCDPFRLHLVYNQHDSVLIANPAEPVQERILRRPGI